LEPFCFGLFGDIIPKGENVGPKHLSGSKGGRGKLCVNIEKEDLNRGKFDLGGVLDDGKRPSKSKWF
jgi:hypothetical protein